jgi:hypothetical protein
MEEKGTPENTHIMLKLLDEYPTVFYSGVALSHVAMAHCQNMK